MVTLVSAWAIALALLLGAPVHGGAELAPRVPHELRVPSMHAPSAPSTPSTPETSHSLVIAVAQMTRITLSAHRSLVLVRFTAPDIGAGENHSRRVPRPPTTPLSPS